MAEKISIICVSGTHERLQMAAMVAAVAGASGTGVHVFLSMNALPFFIKNNQRIAPNEGAMGELMSKKNVPPFKELFENAKELGDAKIHACSMAMDVMGVGVADLDDALDGAMGLTKFLLEAADTQVMVF